MIISEHMLAQGVESMRELGVRSAVCRCGFDSASALFQLEIRSDSQAQSKHAVAAFVQQIATMIQSATLKTASLIDESAVDQLSKPICGNSVRQQLVGSVGDKVQHRLAPDRSSRRIANEEDMNKPLNHLNSARLRGRHSMTNDMT